LDVVITANTIETNQNFIVSFNRSQTVDISDAAGTQTVRDIDITTNGGKIDLGHADLSGGGKIFDFDPGFDLDTSLSNNGIGNTVSFSLKGPQARVETAAGGGDTVVDISSGIIDFSDATFNGFFTQGDPDISLKITSPEASEDDVWEITLDKLKTVSLSTALSTANGVTVQKNISNDPGNELSINLNSLSADEKTALFGDAYDSSQDLNVKAVFSSGTGQIDDSFELNLGGTPTINIEDSSLNNGGTDYVIGTSLGQHTFDLNGILEAGKDPGFDLIIDDPIKGLDDSYTLTLKQSELVAANTEIAELNVKSLQVGDIWKADLIADTLEVGTRYDLAVTAPHLNQGHIYEIEENVGTLKVGEQITVGPINSAFEPTVYTLNSSVTITDGLNINFSADGTFEVGDEIRFQARGYRGDYSVFGQYTDPAYPTTFMVEVTTTGNVDGAARLKVTRLDKNEVIATDVPAVSVADVGNIGGPGYLELGVFMQFDANNGAGEAHRLYQGDIFYIDVVGSLSQNFASQIILESEDNISIEYSEVNVDNSVGRFLYVGDAAEVNNPGTLNSLQSASLGINTEFSVAKLDMTSQEEAEESLRLIDEAIERINDARIKTGAAQSRMNREITSLEELLFQTENYLSRI
jgi:flagellin-like hook-associated protein FlgL